MTSPDRWYQSLVAIREFEETLERWFLQGVVRGAVHLAIGQEAVAVGARRGLADGDWVVPTYRGHAYALAWGVGYREAFAEVLGRRTGCNLGRGGSKHLGDPDRGVVPGNAIVAGGAPLAAGLALQAKLDGTGRVAVAVLGDGALNQGVVSEVFNLAALWKLPVVFLCEHNQYAEMTPSHEMLADPDLTRRGSPYRLPATDVDGMDVEAVSAAVAGAADRARAGGGPSLLVAETYRFCGHMSGDPMTYRDESEVARWRRRDPVDGYRRRLEQLGTPAALLDQWRDAALAQVRQAAALARQDPAPEAAELYHGAPSWHLPEPALAGAIQEGQSA